MAFSADLLQVNPSGDKSTGKFRRSSDGSTRVELSLNYGSKVVPTIDILNFERRVFFRNLGREEWLTGPLSYDERNFVPQPWSSNAPGLEAYP